MIPYRALSGASLLLGLLLAGCDEADPTAPRIEALSLRPVLLRLVEGQSAQLDVDALDGGGTFQPHADVLFGSDEPGVATVSRSGRVEARSPGWTRIWAEADGLTDTVVVAVGLSFDRLLVYCGVAHGRTYCPRNPDDPYSLSRAPSEEPHGLELVHLDRGNFHSCAIDSAQRLWCWGENTFLQLGVETDETCDFNRPCSTVPVEPLPGHRFRALSVGDTHSCSVTIEHELFCWGSNGFGRITGSTEGCTFSGCPTLPYQVGEYTVVAAGANHTCAIRADRAAECWGYNNGALLGLGYSSTEVLPPTMLPGGVEWDTLATGRFVTCGLDTNGARYCWGPQRDEHLGFGDIATTCLFFGTSHPCALTPQSRTGEPGFVSISLDYVSCALDAAGTAFCWGEEYRRNQIGVPGTGDVDVPTAVPLGFSLVAVDARGGTCGLDEHGAILCWGLFEGSTRPLPLDPPLDAPGLAPRGGA